MTAAVGRLADSEWWWEYALDGVIGAVIAGLVTIAALRWTFHRDEQTRFDDALVTDVRALQNECEILLDLLIHQRLEFLTSQMRGTRRVQIVTSRASVKYPRFAQLVAGRWKSVTEGGAGYGIEPAGLHLADQQLVADSLSNLHRDLTNWLTDHKEFEKMSEAAIAQKIDFVANRELSDEDGE